MRVFLSARQIAAQAQGCALMAVSKDAMLPCLTKRYVILKIMTATDFLTRVREMIVTNAAQHLLKSAIISTTTVMA
jgi:hypothetical protein